MSKKGENIYKRKDGRWEGRYIREYLADGKAKYGYVYAKTYTEAKQKLLDRRVAQAQGAVPQTPQPLYQNILKDWLAMSRIHTKESTCARYFHLANTHILPYLGEIALNRLTIQVLERHITFLLTQGRRDGKGGLAPKTVSDILTIIKGSLDYARRSGYDTNCCLDHLTVKKTQTEMRVLSPEEQKKLLETLLHQTDPPKLGVLLSLYTGIRLGEACALKWENIDFTEGILSVRKTLQRIQKVEGGSHGKTKIIVTEPKSRNSIRDIPLPQFILDTALTLRTGPKSYVLTGCADRYMEPRSLQYTFKKYIQESGLRDINYHALRHTFATRCMELGFDVKTLSELLGHASVNITLNRYVHSSLDTKKDSMRRFQP